MKSLPLLSSLIPARSPRGPGCSGTPSQCWDFDDIFDIDSSHNCRIDVSQWCVYKLLAAVRTVGLARNATSGSRGWLLYSRACGIRAEQKMDNEESNGKCVEIWLELHCSRVGIKFLVGPVEPIVNGFGSMSAGVSSLRDEHTTASSRSASLQTPLA
jgi:hypothetical protein